MTKIKVLIADDHALISDAVAAALTQTNEFTVSATQTLSETVAFLESNDDVNVVMLDLVMPGMEGISSIKKIVDLNKRGAVALFSGHAQTQLVHQSIQNGAAGLIPKSLPLKSLSSVLKYISSGQVFLPVDAQYDQERIKLDELSERDIAILKDVADGKTNKEIAWKMNLSEVTIKARMRFIITRLDAKNRASAVINARHVGLI